MFDDLDDTHEFVPSHSFRTAVLRRVRTTRRRRTALRVGGATCAAAIAVPAGFAFYEYHRLDDVHRIHIDAVGDGQPSAPVGAASPPPGSDPTAARESSATSTGTGGTAPSTVASGDAPVPDPPELSSATTFLVVGVDTNEPSGVTGARSDTLMLVRIDPANDQIRLLSVPRDLWVQPPGASKGRRINSLIEPDDPQDLVVVVEQLLDVSVDHFVQIDFQGFAALTDLAGGVDLLSTAALRDDHTGLAIPAGECVTLDGAQALALVRSRHTQYFDGSTWVSDPRSDLGRIERQQFFLGALGAGLLAELDDPASVHDFISAAIDSLVVDQGFGSDEMLSTAWTVRGIGLGRLRTSTVQASGRVIDGNSVLVASDGQIADAISFLREPVEDAPGVGDPDPSSPNTSSPAPTATGDSAGGLPVLQPCTP